MIVDKFKFAGKEYIIIDRFKYEGIEYMYIFEDITDKMREKDLNPLEDKIEATADFVYKCDDGKYENVVDDKLYNKLLAMTNKRNMYTKNEILKKYLRFDK